MIYLASTSPRRKTLLRKAGIKFRVLKPRYREKHIPKAPPSRVVQIHAQEKAGSCVSYVKDGTILAADTLVYCGGEIIGKPGNLDEARQMLAKLQGKWHSVYTGVALFQIKEKRVVKKKVFVEKTRVLIRKLTAAQIKNYFKRVNPLDKAGAYAIQSRHGGIIEDVKGLFSNAVGLPIERVMQRRNLTSESIK